MMIDLELLDSAAKETRQKRREQFKAPAAKQKSDRLARRSSKKAKASKLGAEANGAA